ncbi:MAG: GNAT family N-acetyltransferase [Brucellaceae bacterium]|jgi:GNAT superfamily N-acetyltransferase|nr:GNAT family N-acetyltransferase [Brucellaceae bacterium]
MIAVHDKSACLIRQAQITDAKLLPEIERSAVKTFAADQSLHFILDMPVMSAEQHLDFMQKGHVLVAECDGVPGGFLVAEAMPDEDCLHVWELSVHQDFQRRGLGRKLLDAAAELAKEQGCASLSLTTFGDIPWNRPFYESCGYQVLPVSQYNARFRSIAELEESIGLPIERRVAMVKPL